MKHLPTQQKRPAIHFFNHPTIAILFALVLLFLGCSKDDHDEWGGFPILAEVVSVAPCKVEIKATLNKVDSGYIASGFVIGTTPTVDLQNFVLSFYDIPLTTLSFSYSFTSGLNVNTNYYVRAYVKYESGAVFSEAVNFKIEDRDTVKRVPLLTTSIDTVENGWINLAGHITSKGGSDISKWGIVYSKQTNPTVDNAVVKSDTHPFDNCDSAFSEFPLIEQAVTYYARSYAINSTGIGYGNEVMVTLVDPAVQHLRIVKNQPVDTVLGYLSISSTMYDNHAQVYNKLKLPEGVGLYVVVTAISGSNIKSPLGTPKVGDMFIVPKDSVGGFTFSGTVTAPNAPSTDQCTFAIKLLGKTMEDTYYCNFLSIYNRSNSYKSYVLETQTQYGICETK